MTTFEGTSSQKTNTCNKRAHTVTNDGTVHDIHPPPGLHRPPYPAPSASSSPSTAQRPTSFYHAPPRNTRPASTMLRTAAKAAMRFGANSAVRGMATKKADLLPPLKVAVTGAAGQIGYALVMRIARYVASTRCQCELRVRRDAASSYLFECSVLGLLRSPFCKLHRNVVVTPPPLWRAFMTHGKWA